MSALIYTHVIAAYVSLILLLVRGVMVARGGDFRRNKVLTITPHIAHTLLLLSGFAFFFVVGFSLGEYWIWAKLLFIVLYVVFAAKAFKRNQLFSLKHFILAVISFMLAMAVAVVH